MRKLNTLLLLFVAIINVVAQKYLSETKPLPNEKWYGAFTAKAYCNTPLKDLTFQPYAMNEVKKDLNRDNRGNQAAPLLVSNKGRYVWSNEPFAFEFKGGTLIIYSDHENVEAKPSAGATLRDAYVAAKDKHFPASGKTPNSLMFKMPQYNTWIELGTDQNQAAIKKYADDVVANNFPTGVFMIDDNFSKYYGNFEFDKAAFPDAKGLIDYLHEKNFRIMLWVTPFVSPDSKEFKELAKMKGLVLQKGSKKPALVKWWNGYSGCIDLTNPQAFNWFRTKLKNLQRDYGVDGFKFDAGDFDFYIKDGAYYPNEATNTTGPVQAEMLGKLGLEFDFNEFRAAWKNGNQPLAQRLQDKQYSWDDLKLLVPDMISAGIIGSPFTCPDMIGGGLRLNFENIDYSRFDQELMIRSAQTQALMPMMQFSVAPWRVLDTMHLRICREAAWLHANMGNYINDLAQQAAKDGEPIVRHMEYAFPNEGFESSDGQYMIGKYLVAPVVDKGTKKEVKLPKGNWRDELGNTYVGGQTIEMNIPLNRLPYFEAYQEVKEVPKQETKKKKKKN
jgi:alpha-glucosidase